MGYQKALNISWVLFRVFSEFSLDFIYRILIGCFTTEKSASGISSIVVQLVAFTSGMYFSSDMIGKVFDTICKILPFSNCLNIIKGILSQNYNNILTSSITVIVYVVALSIITSILFRENLMSDNK